MDDLEELYQSIILEHSKNPANQRTMDCPTCSADGDNPFCGDEISLFLKVQDKRIVDLSFTGQGCAISRASASLMTLAVKDKSAQEVTEILQRVLKALTTDNQSLEDAGDLIALQGVRKFPARVKCATLAWHALEVALKKCP
jgi:nitrogen fixation NifU-like protein